MNTTSFDDIALHAGGPSNRRGALTSLAAAALVAAVAAPLPAAANKKSQKKSKATKARQKCQAQVAPCRTVLETQCVGDPDFENCREDAATCCAFFAGCNAQAGMECVISLFIV